MDIAFVKRNARVILCFNNLLVFLFSSKNKRAPFKRVERCDFRKLHNCDINRASYNYIFTYIFFIYIFPTTVSGGARCFCTLRSCRDCAPEKKNGNARALRARALWKARACLEFQPNKILMEKSSIRLISPFLSAWSEQSRKVCRAFR